MRGPHISAGKGRTCKLLQTQQTMGLKPIITIKNSMLDSRGKLDDSYHMGQDYTIYPFWIIIEIVDIANWSLFLLFFFF